MYIILIVWERMNISTSEQNSFLKLQNFLITFNIMSVQ